MSQPPSEFIRFPSIDPPRLVMPHLENVAHYVNFNRKTKTHTYDKTLPLPVITFRGTVKLHGASCAIVQTRLSKEEKVTHFQSRHKILASDVGNDNMGFVSHMSQHQEAIAEMFKLIFHTRSKQNGKSVTADDVKSIAVYGEWCGGNIQKNIAIYQFEKMFVVFAVKINYHPSPSRRKVNDQQEWMDVSLLEGLYNAKAHIFNIYQFEIFEVKIDLADEKSKQDGLREMERLTMGVQVECPVARQLGGTDKQKNGEGIVWQPIRVATPKGAGRTSNLKLEKYSSPTCWMKMKDIKPESHPTSFSVKENPCQKHQGEVKVGGGTKKTVKSQEKRKTAISLPIKASSSKNSLSGAALLSKPLSGNSSSMDFLSDVFSSTTSSVDLARKKSAVPKVLPPKEVTKVEHKTHKVFLDMFHAKSKKVEQKSQKEILEMFNAKPKMDSSMTSPTFNALSADPVPIDSLAATFAFIDSLVSLVTPKWRMEQGQQFQEREMELPCHIRCLGLFVEWVVKDVVKEESDRIENSGLNRKGFMAAIAVKAAEWYVERLQKDWWVEESDGDDES